MSTLDKMAGPLIEFTAMVCVMFEVRSARVNSDLILCYYIHVGFHIGIPSPFPSRMRI